MLKFFLLSQLTAESFINMYLLRFLVVILCLVEEKSNEFTSPELWNSFKHVHIKQYVNVEEENYRYETKLR